jgi:hypothetical protein
VRGPVTVSRTVASVVVAVGALAVAVLVGLALAAGLVGLVGAVPTWIGGLLLLAILGGAAFGSAWWLARVVVPRVAGPDYQRPEAPWVRRLVTAAALAAAALGAGLAASDDVVGALVWLCAIAGGGTLGATVGTGERS